MRESPSPQANPAETHTLAWIIFVSAVLLAFLGIYENRFFSHDDAFITFRYATHLAHGFGLRWNQTGVPTEGFSSPLHVLLLAALCRSQVSLLTLARCVGFTAHILLAGVVFAFLRRQLSVAVAALGCAFVICSWPLLVWDLGGLETSLFTLLLCVGVIGSSLYLEKQSLSTAVLSGVAFGFAILTRSEAISTLLIASGSILFWKTGPFVKRLIASVGVFGSAISVYAPWEVFRYIYYHDYLPNTYWAKVFGVPLYWRLVSGTVYLKLFLSLPPFLLVLAFVTTLVALRQQRFVSQSALLWACTIAYIASVTIVGGDHMTSFRFLAPIVPLLAILISFNIESIQDVKRPVLLNAWCSIFLVSAAAQAGAWHLNPRFREITCAGGEIVAGRIRKVWPAGSSIALNVAGALPYYADGYSYTDMLGLNDRTIAKRQTIPPQILSRGVIGHLKGDGEYILALKPDYIIFETAFGSGLRPNETGVSLTPFELAKSPKFFAEYQKCGLLLEVPQAIERESELPPRGELVYFQKRALRTSCAH